MDKSDFLLLAQFVAALNDLALQLQTAFNSKDMVRLELIKKEMLSLQAKIDKLL